MALEHGFGAPTSDPLWGQARAFAGCEDANLRSPCGHGIPPLTVLGVYEGAVAPAVVKLVAGLNAGGTSRWGAAGGALRCWGMSRRTTPTSTRLLTTRQAASELGVHERTVRRYISSGVLAYRRLPGGHYRIPERAILEFWERNKGADASSGRCPQTADGAAVDVLGVAQRLEGRRSPRPVNRDEGSAASYDLSPEALAVLRSQVEARSG